MDSVKAKDVPQTSKDTKPMTSVEEYQRRWAQLMDDTAKQIQKIRGAQTRSSRNPDMKNKPGSPARPRIDDIRAPLRERLRKALRL
ncbi:uncharacterized protein N7496_000872 [Penicillium cataractarum]|uniref:Uncharacterized protein n=1 Tax=Penicillium cataractarum TaxID=2100454 RepID=A0A9W9VV93_9EURO|nr:uncharacterized protein N7496_000872 [Penicillium cataractarum]KAJ5389804.1 hypothetical protein N7496_000872 [Penicillium cataractarum]